MGTIESIIIQLLFLYSYVVIAYILMSWFPNAKESTIGQFIGSIVEPYLSPFRKIIPPLGMIDISPIVGIIALRFASYGVSALFAMF